MTTDDILSPGVWRLTVAEVVEETADARSIVFDIPEADGDAFRYKPGQFLTLRIPSDRTGSVARCYSLASSPFTGEAPKVTVKRTRGGYGSNWLCDNIAAGDTIDVLRPSGVFTPADLDVDLLLLGAGSGITPVMSILKSALLRGSGHVTLYYANRDHESVIFATELRELTQKYPERLTVVHWLESLQGLPAVAHLTTFAALHPTYTAYMCGPTPFMDSARTALESAGFARKQIHAEVFSSLAGDPFAPASSQPQDSAEASAGEVQSAVPSATVHVELDGESHELDWPRDKTLVDIMLAHDIDVPYSCRSGECGSCACTLVDGEIEMTNSEILDPEDIADGYMLGCQAHPVSERIRIEF